MAIMSERWAKRPKLDLQAKLDANIIAANIIVQFQADTGEITGPQLDVPQSVTPKELEQLLNGLLQNEERLPYGFYIDTQELAASLGAHLHEHEVSVEKALRIVYQPQAVFRVRPVARCTASMSGHSDAVLSVNFSPDGKRLASGSGDTTVRFWDLGTQLPDKTCKNHKNWVQCVAWSPDAACLASGDQNGAVWLWNPATGEPLGQCRGHSKCITSMAWEPAHVQLPCRRLVTASQDCTAKVWDISIRQCVFTLSGHTHLVSCVKWGGDGLIHTSSRDGSIMVWDAKVSYNLLQNGAKTLTLAGHGHWVNTLALSAEYALRTGAYDHTAKAPASDDEGQQIALKRYQAACSGQPERLVSGSDDFTIFLWEPSKSKKPLGRMTGHLQLINQVQFSPDGRWIVSASFDKSVKLWDGLKGVFVATLRGHVGPVYQVAWSADSRLLVSGSKDSTLKVWDVHTRKLRLDLPGHADEVYTVDWSPDGASVASGGKDKVLKLWRQ